MASKRKSKKNKNRDIVQNGINWKRRNGLQFGAFRGTLGKDPDIKTIGKGKKKQQMAKFLIGIDDNRPIYEDGEFTGEYEKEMTSWFQCVAFGETAEEISYFEQGEHIQITDGVIKQNIWDDDEGVTHYDFSFTVFDFEEWESPYKKDDEDDD